jgi:hypothetical protein
MRRFNLYEAMPRRKPAGHSIFESLNFNHKPLRR